MAKRIKTLLGQVASFALAGGLLYLALRDVDFGEVAAALASANYWWLIPLATLTIVSHLLRSWRWQILLYELPGAQRDRPVSLYNAFSALIVGYFANYAAPRVGELVRAGLLARNERLSVSGVVGTVVLERVLDIVVLILCVGITFVMLLDRFEVISELLLDPLLVWWAGVPLYALVAGAVAALVAGTVVVSFWRRSLRASGKGSRLRGLVDSFIAGMATLSRTRRTGAVVIGTILMWACYVVMTHLPFLVLGMTGPFNLTLVDSFYIMTLGAIGVAIPAPGGTGSYHYIAIQSLVLLFGVSQSPAATYAVLTHAAQLVLYAALATYFIASQKASIGEIRKLEHDAEAAIRQPPG
ncbi:MAG: lysylphosphatidylglycerol synthase transmembrane domain-containing protein [Rhodothermales bacterium]|nr:lysylphosphatidylglycerol synthase transmembrane domain-containing protein [Rhodothermales bacterium]